MGKTIDISTGDGKFTGYLASPASGKGPGVLVLQEIFGVNKVMRDIADPATGGITGWRQRLAIVFQDFVRFQLPAADNVTLGAAGSPDREAMVAAAVDAGLAEVVDRLPDGWSTPLARSRTGGVDLSGGQWQQVALARALYALRRGARILVLDEPTAHLDVRTEFELFERLSRVAAGASVILISHRLSTVRLADRIVLLADGHIAESGSHDELIAADGRYAELFRVQAERFTKGYDDRLDDDRLDGAGTCAGVSS